MKTTNQSLRNIAAGLAIAAALFVGPSATHAAVNILSGGDPADGTPDGYQRGLAEVYAYDLTYDGATPTPANQTVQGIVFEPWLVGSASSPDGGATYSGSAGPYGTGGTTITGGSANDTAMNNMLLNGWYATGGGPITFTITGLTSGRPYQIDALVDANTPGYDEVFTFNGTILDSFVPASQVSYDVVETVTAVGGQITMAVSGNAGATTVISGLSVATTPEPASMSLLVAGGLMLLKRRRA